MTGQGLAVIQKQGQSFALLNLFTISLFLLTSGSCGESREFIKLI
jgi:hypothetical protein